MKVIIKIIASLMWVAVSLTTVSGQIRIISDPDQHIAWERFDSFMENEYSGEEKEFTVEINGNNYNFKIQFHLDASFISAMQRAEAISFFGDRYIVCWFPEESQPLYENLRPGIRRHFADCFQKISFIPSQKKVYDPVKRRKTRTEEMSFYRWNSQEYARMQAE